MTRIEGKLLAFVPPRVRFERAKFTGVQYIEVDRKLKKAVLDDLAFENNLGIKEAGHISLEIENSRVCVVTVEKIPSEEYRAVVGDIIEVEGDKAGVLLVDGRIYESINPAIRKMQVGKAAERLCKLIEDERRNGGELALVSAPMVRKALDN